MVITENNALFTSLTVEESATICGGGIVVVLKGGVNNLLSKTESDLIEEAKRLGLNPQIVQDIKKEVLASR